MWVGSVMVDGNGIVIFDPEALSSWRGPIAEGTDLFTEFTTTEVGDEVLERGLFVPVLAIDDAGYDIAIRTIDEPRCLDGDVMVTNGVFALHVVSGLVVADLAVLRYWLADVAWTRVPMPSGSYAVTIDGIRRLSADKTLLACAGYELTLTRCDELPRVTGDVGREMRVLNWWDGKK